MIICHIHGTNTSCKSTNLLGTRMHFVENFWYHFQKFYYFSSMKTTLYFQLVSPWIISSFMDHIDCSNCMRYVVHYFFKGLEFWPGFAVYLTFLSTFATSWGTTWGAAAMFPQQLSTEREEKQYNKRQVPKPIP